jgi:hypothetical protein
LPYKWTSPTLARQGASYGVQGVETGRGRGRGKFLYTIPFLAVFWTDGERAGDNGIVVANGK